MSSTNYTRWWRDGTIAVTNNSNAVVGTSTYWATANINPGDIMKINGVDYEVQSVTDNTHLTLATPYTGNAASGLGYAIIRNFTSTTNAKVAAQTSELMYDFAHFIDKEHSTITGKSAYEVARDNGYTGTEAQWLDSLTAYGVAKKGGYTGTQAEWLESLKAAGEWDNANTRISALEARYAFRPYEEATKDTWRFHKIYHRFKNLGNTITAEQWTGLYNTIWNMSNTERDFYVGDYWELNTGRAVILDFSTYYHGIAEMALVTKIGGPMNNTATTEGGYLGSKMHNEVIPQILADLEAEIGANHIKIINNGHESTYDSPEFSNTGEEHAANEPNAKMNLFKLQQIFGDVTPESGIRPFALFQYPPVEWLDLFPWNFWVQDVYRGDPTKQFMGISRDSNYLFHDNANSYVNTNNDIGMYVVTHFQISR